MTGKKDNNRKRVTNADGSIYKKERHYTKDIVYKIDVMEELKNIGYTRKRLKEEKVFGESTITKIKKGELASWNVMRQLCTMFNCDISDIIHCVDVEE